MAARYFPPENKQKAKSNAEALDALTPSLNDTDRVRAQEMIRNLSERIEERRQVQPIKAGPGESET